MVGEDVRRRLASLQLLDNTSVEVHGRVVQDRDSSIGGGLDRQDMEEAEACPCAGARIRIFPEEKTTSLRLADYQRFRRFQ